MVSDNKLFCPKCGHTLKYYDKVKRIVRTKHGRTCRIKLRRFKCSNCAAIHREIPDCIFPYKQYEAEIIRGVLDGFITNETLGYEDYPCELTMLRWQSCKRLYFY